MLTSKACALRLGSVIIFKVLFLGMCAVYMCACLHVYIQGYTSVTEYMEEGCKHAWSCWALSEYFVLGIQAYTTSPPLPHHHTFSHYVSVCPRTHDVTQVGFELWQSLCLGHRVLKSHCVWLRSPKVYMYVCGSLGLLAPSVISTVPRYGGTVAA